MACCPNDIPPVVNDYTGKGEKLMLMTDAGGAALNVVDPRDGLTSSEFGAYHAGSGERGILHVPDIWGLHPNNFQVADILAGQGFNVLTVDPFLGNPVPFSPFPPPGGWPEVMGHVSKFTWDKVRPVLMAGLAELKKRGATKIGGLGLCWGGGQLFVLSAEKVMHVVATAHPSTRLQKADAEKLSGPVCFLPAGDDPEWKDMEQYITTESPFAKQNVYIRFPDMTHGWLGARGKEIRDYGVKAQQEGAMKALRIIADFFKATL